jgi:CBS domain-containing protein
MDSWDFFTATSRVKDLLPSNFQLIRVTTAQKAPDVLRILREKQIHAVPVYDEQEQRYIGFISMLDIVDAVSYLSKSQTQLENIVQHKLNIYQFIEKEFEIFSNQPLTEFVDLSDCNPWNPVRDTDHLSKVAELFGADINLHRVPVINHEGNVVGIITQSMFINFIVENMTRVPDTVLNKPISEFSQLKFGEVQCIHFKDKALEAFQLMGKKEISGIAVVDNEGKLVGCISVSDLKGSQIDHNLFADLYKPIDQYLLAYRQDFQRDKSLNPIWCTENVALREVLMSVSKNKVHRMIVVDIENKPICMLSLCQLISLVTNK